MNYLEKYQRWMNSSVVPNELKKELESIAEDDTNGIASERQMLGLLFLSG